MVRHYIRPVLAVLDAVWRVLQPAMRFLAWLCLLPAVIALVYDYTMRGLSGEATFTSVWAYWAGFAPGSLEAFQQSVATRLGSFFWDTVLLSILNRPLWLVFGALSALLAWFGNPADRTRVFVN